MHVTSLPLCALEQSLKFSGYCRRPAHAVYWIHAGIPWELTAGVEAAKPQIHNVDAVKSNATCASSTGMEQDPEAQKWAHLLV